MPLITQMIGQLRLKPGLQHPPYQLGQKPALPVNCKSPLSTWFIKSSSIPAWTIFSTASRQSPAGQTPAPTLPASHVVIPQHPSSVLTSIEVFTQTT